MAEFNTLGTRYTIDFDTQTDVLKDVINDINAMKLGAAGAEAVITKFIKTLGDIDTTGKSVKDINSGFGEISKLLDKASYSTARFKREFLEARAAQMKTAAGWIRDFKGEKVVGYGNNSEDNEKENGIPRYQRILRVGHAFQSLKNQITGSLRELSKVNREILLLSYNTQMAVREITAMGGALEAFGGSKGEAASFARSFEVEQAKMMVGQGTGGKFMEASRLWGLDWHPEDFAAQEREIVKFLSDPNRTKTEKIGLQNTLGLSNAQVSRYSRGLEEFEKENARQKEFTKNTEEMAKASDEYLRSTQHLKAAYEDMRAMAMIPLLTVCSGLSEVLADLTTWMRDSFIGKIFGLMTLGGAAFLKFAGPVVGLMAQLRMAGMLGGGAAAAGGVAAKAAGGVAAGAALGPIGAIVGLVSGVVGAVAGVAEAIIAGLTLAEIKDIRKLLDAWKESWEDANGIEKSEELGEVGDERGGAKTGKALVNTALSGPFGFTSGIMSMMLGPADILLLTVVRSIAGHTLQLVEFSRDRIKRNGKLESSQWQAAQITVEKIDISVASDSANPNDVAEAVRECLLREMQNVVISMEPGGEV